MKAGQEPSPESATDVVPAAPSKPQEFNLVLLTTASEQDGDEVGSEPTEVHCVVSLEVSDPTALASTLQILPAKEQVPTVPRKRSRVDTGETSRPAALASPLLWACMLRHRPAHPPPFPARPSWMAHLCFQ
jgi:hypothetical protein